MHDSKQDVLTFWFTETEPALWFQENEQFDAVLRHRFMGDCEIARDGMIDAWKNDADGCLALVLLLNQIPRHIYRGHAKAYAGDNKALLASKHAIARGFDQVMTPVRRRFLYLPFMHSENLTNQKKSLELYGRMQKDDPVTYEHAQRNYRLIEQFGRFPNRNKAMGRESTPEEQAWLTANS